MKRNLFAVGAVLLSAMAAYATDFDRYEVFAGYSFVRFHPNSSCSVTNCGSFLPDFNANGGSGQFVYNFKDGLGVALDLGAVTKGTLHTHNVDSTVLNFVIGPRFTYHESPFQLFVQALFGGAYSTSSARIDILNGTIVAPPIFPPAVIGHLNGPLTTRLVASRTGFAMLAGGGLDFKVSKHVSIRPVGADYYLTRLPGILTGNRIPPEVCALEGFTDCGPHRSANNFRYTAGVNFMFGKE